MHLTPEELIDLAEGHGAQTAAAHMASCDACRQQLAGLHTALSIAADVAVPEPPAWFGDHLAARVRERIAADDPPVSKRGRPPFFPVSWSAAAVAGVAAAVVLAMVMTAPRNWSPGAPALPRVAGVDAVLPPFGAPDDPALALVADLTRQITPEALADTGWTGHAGGIEEAVANLTASERLELRRLLEEALEQRKAS